MSKDTWSNSKLGGVGAIHIDQLIKRRKCRGWANGTKHAHTNQYQDNDDMSILGRFKRATFKKVMRGLDKEAHDVYGNRIK